MQDKLRIGIIGTRGIPNRYGGFEVFAEEFALRMAARGHHVTVYCPHNHPFHDAELHGVHLRYCHNPEVYLGTAGQFFYDLLCNIDSRRRHFHVILHLGYTSDSVWSPVWSPRSKHVTNMDGMEWKRPKYSPKVQSFLRKAERWAAIRSHFLIADSHGIFDYLRSKYTTPARFISYGSDLPGEIDPAVLQKYEITPYHYDLMVARMEPENNIEMAILSRTENKTDVPLLIFSNETKYGKRLKKEYGGIPLVRFQEAVYIPEILNAIRYYSRYYIHGHSAGGTNPSLLQAMASGCRILAHDNIFNRGVLGENASFFNNSRELIELLNQPWDKDQFADKVAANLQAIQTEHNWESITSQYEDALYQTLEL